MAYTKTITLRFPGKCADCGASLPVGTRARWYGRGRVYGTTCHEQKPRAGRVPFSPSFLESAADNDPVVNSYFAARERKSGPCEDAPCCGCCGPGSDDPAYQPYEPADPDYGY